MPYKDSRRLPWDRRTSGALVLAICLAALHAPAALGASIVESVRGSAYGVHVSVNLLVGQGHLGPTPIVSLPTSGGTQAATLASSSLLVGSPPLQQHVLTTGILTVESKSTGVGGPDGEVSSGATVNDVNVLGGVLMASEIFAECSADISGASGSVTLVDASVAGVGNLSVSPQPNTGITVPLVGSLVLNKQTTTADGTLSVTALSLSLLPALGTGTINIGHVTCGAAVGTDTSTTTTVVTTSTSVPSATTSTSVPSTTTSTSGTSSTTIPGDSSTTTVVGSTSTTFGSPSTTIPYEPPADDQETWCVAESVVGSADTELLALGIPVAPTPTPGPSSSAAIPWWWAVVVAVVAGGLGFYLSRVEWTLVGGRLRGIRGRA